MSWAFWPLFCAAAASDTTYVFSFQVSGFRFALLASIFCWLLIHNHLNTGILRKTTSILIHFVYVIHHVKNNINSTFLGGSLGFNRIFPLFVKKLSGQLSGFDWSTAQIKTYISTNLLIGDRILSEMIKNNAFGGKLE